MPRLVVNPGGPESWEIELPTGSVSLGRGEENDFPIEHSSVSSSHCLVTRSATGVRIKDLGSTSGTFVEDELIEEAWLKPGQLIRLGEIRVRYESDQAKLGPESPGTPPLPPRLPAYRVLTPILASGSKSKTDFLSSLPNAFAYPFRGSGVILLLGGTAFFFILGHLPLVGVLFTGYLFSYAKSIINSSATGLNEPPDWPDFSDWKDDIAVPYLQLIALVVLTFGPAYLIGLWHPGNEFEGRIAFFLVLGFGALMAPMGMLALAMFDTVTALNPIGLTWSILRMPGHYLVAAAAFELVVAFHWFAEARIRSWVPVPLLADLASSFLYLYLIAVGMRMLGLLYVTHKDELGWFRSLSS